jgi:hypothetical protein
VSTLLALAFLAMAVIVVPQTPAQAAESKALANLCTVAEWQADINGCVARLADVSAARAQCLEAPPPDTPDAGIGGWFASQPLPPSDPGVKGFYVRYGYAGYSYTTYDIGCVQTLMHPDFKFENTVANGEFLAATALLGSANALRERAWEPGLMWSWADPLVSKATRSIYTQVFTVFGIVTLAVVGLYLIWRSRQAQMSRALTTAGWAVLVMVVVTALANWPTFSAHFADNALVSSLNVVDNAVGPPSAAKPPGQCPFANQAACEDNRPPAVRASDTVVKSMLYRDWLRGLLGSADSVTAQKYGPALYAARSLTWDETAEFRSSVNKRNEIIAQKANQWEKVAEQIRAEDPEAYQYLQGTQGMQRIGAGFIALLSALLFSLFDITASVLILLGFLLIRWAVIAAPLVGTVAILQPASAGFRRLVNAVVAAIFNVVIFGTGAAVYLFAVDLVMGTTSLPGWLQIILVGLSGVAGWMLLRPYRRITQLAGGTTAAAALIARRPQNEVVDASASAASILESRRPQRVETQPDSTAPATSPVLPVPISAGVPDRRTPPPAGSGWIEPAPESISSFAVYHPARSSDAPSRSEPGQVASAAGMRAEARREG